MKSKKEIEKKYFKLTEKFFAQIPEDAHPCYLWSLDAQRYILEWVLDRDEDHD